METSADLSKSLGTERGATIRMRQPEVVAVGPRLTYLTGRHTGNFESWVEQDIRRVVEAKVRQ